MNIPQRFYSDGNRSPLAGQVVATIRKGSPSFPAKSRDGKPYNAVGLDLGQFLRIDTSRPQDGRPLNYMAAMQFAALFPTVEFVGSPGRLAELASAYKGPTPAYRFSCLAATEIQCFVPQFSQLSEVFRVEYTEGSTKVSESGTRTFTTIARCDGETASIYDRATNNYNTVRCRAYGDPLRCDENGAPMMACERCKPSVTLYLRTRVGIIAVSSHSSLDARNFVDFFMRGIGQQYGPNIHRVPLILSRRLMTTVELRLEGKTWKKIPTEKWQYQLSISPAFIEREFQLIEAHAAQAVTGLTLPEAEAPVARIAAPPPPQQQPQPHPPQPPQSPQSETTTTPWTLETALAWTKVVPAVMKRAESETAVKKLKEITEAFNISVPEAARQTVQLAAAHIHGELEAMFALVQADLLATEEGEPDATTIEA